MEIFKVVAKILNIPEAKAKEFIDAEDEDAIIDLNKTNLQKKFDDGHKKASKLATKAVVDAFKSEFDFDISGESAEDIVSSIKIGLEGRSADDISEETIKGSEAYKKLQSEVSRAQQDQNKIVEKEVNKRLKEKETEFNTKLKQTKREALNTKLERAAEEWLTDNKAIMPTDPVKRKKLIKEIANKLANDEIEEDEEGNFLITNADGTPLLNKDGFNATLADRFSEYDYLVRFQDVQHRESTGLPAGGGNQGGAATFKHFKGEVPKSESEMSKYHLEYSEGTLSKDAYHEVKAAYAEQTKK